MKHEHKLECEALLGNLSEFIDGELDDRMCQELQRHMSGCENCRVVYDTLTRTIFLYQAEVTDEKLPDAVRERLFNTLNIDDLLKPKA